MKLYHCNDARSLRPLWALEEMGLDYELINMEFPPRFSYPGYLDINPLGTVPAFVDGDLTMTESSGICHYLVEKYGPTDIGIAVDEPGYGDYLNWLYRSDATLTFPQTLVLRYTRLEPEERRQPGGGDALQAAVAALPVRCLIQLLLVVEGAERGVAVLLRRALRHLRRAL